MRISRLAAFGLVFAVMLTTSAQAQRDNLKAGDAAPGLRAAWLGGPETPKRLAWAAGLPPRAWIAGAAWRRVRRSENAGVGRPQEGA